MVALSTIPLQPLRHITILVIRPHILMPRSHHYRFPGPLRIHKLVPVSRSLSRVICANSGKVNLKSMNFPRKQPSIQSPNWAETSGTVHGNRLWGIGNILTHHARFLLQWRTGIQPFSGQGRRRWNLDNVKLLLLNLLMREFHFTECQSCWHLLFQV